VAATAGPLADIGILVTRPARQAGAFAQKIAALGAAPVIFPAIAILPSADPARLARAHATLGNYDFAVFVSANAVEYGVPDARAWPPTITTFATGPGTAEALAAVGITGARVPTTTFDTEGLLALAEFVAPRGKRIVIFRGDGGREQLGDALRARGATVDFVACYQRAAPEVVRRDGRGLSRRAHRRGDDHVERRSRQPVGIGRRSDAQRMAQTPDVRTASAHCRARPQAGAPRCRNLRKRCGNHCRVDRMGSHHRETEMNVKPHSDIIVTAPLPPFLYEPLKADYRCHDYVQATDKAAFLAGCGAMIRGLVQGGGTVTPTTLLDALPALEIISVFGVGYDGVPVDYCRGRGIKVTNTPDVLTDDVADVAVGLS
jgi:hypothetical protein